MQQSRTSAKPAKARAGDSLPRAPAPVKARKGTRATGAPGVRAQETPDLIDPEGFMGSIQAKAQLIRDGYAAGRAAAPRRLRAKGLLMSGMGFSGLVADVVQDAATRVLRVPVWIVKHYQFPSNIGKGWHTLAITYSGDTEETVAVVRSSLERRVPVTAFTTGGKVAGMVERVVGQPLGHQPRAAFAHTWFSVLGFLEASRVLGEPVPAAQAAAAVEEVARAGGPDVPEAGNPAKQLARKIWHAVPQIYATPAFHGVGQHFRGMLNENAKKIAKVDLVPESNHGDLTGWSGDEENRSRFSVVALRHGGQNPEIQKRLAFMEERYTAWGVPWTNREAEPIETFAQHVVEQAKAIQFLDYTSVYVAALRGQDPADIREIKALKRLLRQGA